MSHKINLAAYLPTAFALSNTDGVIFTYLLCSDEMRLSPQGIQVPCSVWIGTAIVHGMPPSHPRHPIHAHRKRARKIDPNIPTPFATTGDGFRLSKHLHTQLGPVSHRKPPIHHDSSANFVIRKLPNSSPHQRGTLCIPIFSWDHPEMRTFQLSSFLEYVNPVSRKYLIS